MMGDKSKGFVTIYRSLQNHWIWSKKPFSWGQAWIDLILSANFEPRKQLIGGLLEEIGPGQLLITKAELAERWGWSVSKVDRFLIVLKEDSMISVNGMPNVGTIITVENYTLWQDMRMNDDMNSERIANEWRMNSERIANEFPYYNHSTIEPLNHSRASSTTRTQDEESELDEAGKPEEGEDSDADSTGGESKLEDEKIPYAEIVDYLNERAGKAYRSTGKSTRSKIQTRWNEGFRLDDFKRVIDVKVSQWKGDKEMDRYLRPETLFGPKFEGYLNEDPKNTGEPVYSRNYADKWEAYK